MKAKAIIAIAVFLLILALPFLASAANGTLGKGDPRPIASQAQYVQYYDIGDMRNHMNLIKPEDAQSQCLGCHANKEQFCVSCHNYAGVNPGI